MTYQNLPSPQEAQTILEKKLSEIMEETCKIEIHDELNGILSRIISDIDHRQFRMELQYSDDELRKFSQINGFMIIMVYSGSKPIGLFFGYEDQEFQGGFYGDTLASLVEGKGIGGALFAFVHLLCFSSGYSHFSMRTEEVDEKGRRLRDWYTHTGMKYLGTHPRFGDYMRVKLTPSHVSWMYKRFILGQKGLTRPLE